MRALGLASLVVVSFLGTLACSSAGGIDDSSGGTTSAGGAGGSGGSSSMAEGGVAGSSAAGYPLGGSGGTSLGIGGSGGLCGGGTCTPQSCDQAAGEPSNVGCEFWAADLDMSDLINVQSHPWGLVISNAGTLPANVTIERNTAPYGMPPTPTMVNTGMLMPGQLGVQSFMPTMDMMLDCGTMLDDHNAPGTCISSHAFHVTSDSPIVVYQINNLDHAYSTDASLLLPVTAIGDQYRVLGWPSAHPFAVPSFGLWAERTYITVIGTQANTQVTVTPSWRIKANGSIPLTQPGTPIVVTLGPFDVLNLESDDGTAKECTSQTAPVCTDLTGSTVEATAPVVVFSGTESSGVTPPGMNAPVPPSGMGEDPTTLGCCLQHFEEQLAPLQAIGKKFVVTRSPIRSTGSDGYIEPDVIRFVGAAEPATVMSNLAAPFDNFTIMPGEVVDTWTQTDVIVEASAPILVGQFLVAGGYVDPSPVGDPSFTIFPPVEQAQTNYLFLSPDGWDAFVVISAVVGSDVQVDGAEPQGCVVAQAGMLDGVAYEARRCKLGTGVHSLTGDMPFGIMAYGYADADAYAFPGGSFFKKIYMPPPLH
jgi:hypothetical protein